MQLHILLIFLSVSQLPDGLNVDSCPQVSTASQFRILDLHCIEVLVQSLTHTLYVLLQKGQKLGCASIMLHYTTDTASTTCHIHNRLH